MIVYTLFYDKSLVVYLRYFMYKKRRLLSRIITLRFLDLFNKLVV